MRMPRVSVIIPVYNGELYLSETLDSVMKQTFTDWEIIVVNDGSTDKSLEIMEEYAALDERVRVISKPNGGVSSARNVAMNNAKGEYFSFVDADDMWVPEKLEKQIAFMDKNPNIALIYSDISILIDGNIRTQNMFLNRKFHKGHIFDQLFYFNFISTPTVMLRKKIIEQHGNFSTRFRGIEDYDLWLRIADKNEIGYINERLAIYRIHANNTSGNYEKMEKQVFELIGIWLEKKPELMKSFSFNIKIVQMRYNIMRYNLAKGNILKVLKELWLASFDLIGINKQKYMVKNNS